MNLVFIYLGEECLVIIYSVSELAMGKVDVCFEPGNIEFIKSGQSFTSDYHNYEWLMA